MQAAACTQIDLAFSLFLLVCSGCVCRRTKAALPTHLEGTHLLSIRAQMLLLSLATSECTQCVNYSFWFHDYYLST